MKVRLELSITPAEADIGPLTNATAGGKTLRGPGPVCRLRVVNLTNEPIAAPHPAFTRAGLFWKLKGPDGERESGGEADPFVPEFPRMIPPLGVFEREIALADLFPLEAPGEYELRAEMLLPDGGGIIRSAPARANLHAGRVLFTRETANGPGEKIVLRVEEGRKSPRLRLTRVATGMEARVIASHDLAEMKTGTEKPMISVPVHGEAEHRHFIAWLEEDVLRAVQVENGAIKGAWLQSYDRLKPGELIAPLLPVPEWEGAFAVAVFHCCRPAKEGQHATLELHVFTDVYLPSEIEEKLPEGMPLWAEGVVLPGDLRRLYLLMPKPARPGAPGGLLLRTLDWPHGHNKLTSGAFLAIEGEFIASRLTPGPIFSANPGGESGSATGMGTGMGAGTGSRWDAPPRAEPHPENEARARARADASHIRGEITVRIIREKRFPEVKKLSWVHTPSGELKVEKTETLPVGLG